MLKYKDGVTGDPMPPLAWALAETDSVFGWFGHGGPTITALRNGQHKLTSLHSRGYAADIRTSDLSPNIVTAVVATLKRRLTGFDVVLEASDTPGATAPHIHLEFDPEGNGGKNLP